MADVVGEFVHLTVRVAPYFLLGALSGAALQTLIGQRWAERLRRRAHTLPAAVTAGALLPGCSCATMPMAAGLRDPATTRIGNVVAFIVVSPLLSPITIGLTWGVLGWRMTLARTIASVAGSLMLGVLVDRLQRSPPRSLTPVTTPAGGSPAGDCTDACGDAACATPDAPVRFSSALAQILRIIAPYFIVGMFAAAILSVALPEDGIPTLLGGSAGLGAYALAALVAIPVYVCEGEEVPLTYALTTAGLGPGPAFTFLLGSVGTCVPTILMTRKLIGPAFTRLYVGFWFLFAIGSGLLFEAAV